MDDKTLEDALVVMVHDIFEKDREELSVNNVRKRCETQLELEEGFFASAEWKGKSKGIIKGRVVSVLLMLLQWCPWVTNATNKPRTSS